MDLLQIITEYGITLLIASFTIAFVSRRQKVEAQRYDDMLQREAQRAERSAEREAKRADRLEESIGPALHNMAKVVAESIEAKETLARVVDNFGGALESNTTAIGNILTLYQRSVERLDQETGISREIIEHLTHYTKMLEEVLISLAEVKSNVERIRGEKDDRI